MSDRASGALDLENQQLNALLTWLFGAVSQQFFHMLLLGKRGRPDMVARLKVVDDTDFPNAMQIIDLLLRRGATISVEPHFVAPAKSTRAILQTELEFEQRLAAFLQSLEMQSTDGQERLAQAEKPREDYQGWLSKTLKHLPVEPADMPSGRKRAQLFSVLLRLMEQTLLHAFANWHEGRAAEASTAWQISGATMLYLTALADFCGSDDWGTGGIDVPKSTIVGAQKRFEADIQLVCDSATAARTMTEASDDPRLVQLCLTIAEDCDRVALTNNGDPIHAMLGSSDVFRDFRRARDRMKR